jgi:DNA modification methylase
MVFVYKNGTAPHINNVQLGRHGRYRTNVWNYRSPNALLRQGKADLEAHPTIKPARMIADALQDCSHRGGIVLDSFGGSGSTLIAAENTGRHARLIELEPRYLDVIITRWEKLTGRSAVHAGTGRTFADMREERRHG